MKPSPTVVVACAGLGLLACGAYQAVRSALAEHLYLSAAPGAMRQAIDLEPGRVLYPVGLAEVLTADGEDPRPWLRRAVAVQPDDASIHIRLGLASEMAGDLEEAERELLAAAQVNAKYEPRWTLANFYFRRGNGEAFWRWAREAAAISYGNRTALFELCWRQAPDAALILDRAIPPRRPVRMDYAAYLVGHSQWPVAGQLLRELAAAATPAETGRFLRLTDQALGARRFSIATDLWNSLSRSGSIPYPPLDSAAGPLPVNGDFGRPPLGQGFDWRRHPAGGIFQTTLPAGGYRLSLSGDQPENCVVVSTYIPLLPGREYRLATLYRSSVAPLAGSHDSTGLRWRVVSLTEPPRLIAESAPLPVVSDSALEQRFATPTETTMVRLELHHRREPGTTRFAGSVLLERVTLELLEPAPE